MPPGHPQAIGRGTDSLRTRLALCIGPTNRIGSTVAQTGHTVLPRFRLVVAIMAVLALTALGISLFSAPRNNSVFVVGLRSAQGSPVERSLPEPPDWKQFVALAALRRSQELDRLLDLPVSPPSDERPANAPANTPVDSTAAATDETGPSAGLAAPEASPTSPETTPDVDTTSAIDRPPASENPVTLQLPDLPDIPDVMVSFRQALAREAPQASDTADALNDKPRIATAPTVETETRGALPAVTLPTHVRLPPVRPPRVVVRKKPRMARARAARQPAATNPAAADPFAGLFGPPPTQQNGR